MSEHPEGKIGRLKPRKGSRQGSVGPDHNHLQHGESLPGQKNRLQIRVPFPGNPNTVFDGAANRLRAVIRQWRRRRSGATTLRTPARDHPLQRAMRTGWQPRQYEQQPTDGPDPRHDSDVASDPAHSQATHQIHAHRPGPFLVPNQPATLPPNSRPKRCPSSPRTGTRTIVRPCPATAHARHKRPGACGTRLLMP